MNEGISGTWEEFEEWIRATIGSDFRWKIRPKDDTANRKMIADLIRDAMKRNDGVFPKGDVFLERA